MCRSLCFTVKVGTEMTHCFILGETPDSGVNIKRAKVL